MKEEELELRREIEILKAFKAIKNVCNNYEHYNNSPEDKYYEIKGIVEDILKE